MKYLFIIIILLTAPLISNAEPYDFRDFTNYLINIIGLAIPAAVAFALFIFIWGLAKFLSGGGNENALKEGKALMFWGIIGLFVLLSSWGLASIIAGSFDFQFGTPKLPYF